MIFAADFGILAAAGKAENEGGKKPEPKSVRIPHENLAGKLAELLVAQHVNGQREENLGL